METAGRCLYADSFAAFLAADPNAVLGALHANYHGETITTTDDAWRGEIALLQEVLLPWKDENARIVFEYGIPRLGKRIDVVLLLRGTVFCLEFKVGRKDVLQADVEQVMDYALDLKNFHLRSRKRIVVPVLVPTGHASSSTEFRPSVYDDGVCNPLVTGANGLGRLLAGALEATAGGPRPNDVEEHWPDGWIVSPYSPTPTIVEAARALYENHSVEEITRHEADRVSTDRTIRRVMEIVAESERNRTKSICFVTGVPGAGKTLVGLEVAVKLTYGGSAGRRKNAESAAVYLSGN